MDDRSPTAHPSRWSGFWLATVLAGVLWAAPPVSADSLDFAEFFVTDAQSRRVFGYDAEGALVGSFGLDSANSTPAGITADGVAAHVLNVRNKKVYRYDMAGSLEAISAELRRADGASLSSPSGLVIDEDQMWVVDRGRARIFRYSLFEAFATTPRVNAIQEITLLPENSRAVDLAMDDTWLYVLDETDRQIYRYLRWGTGAVEASAVMLQPSGSSLGAPAGVTLGLASLHVVDRSKDAMFQYSLDDLFVDIEEPLPATSQFALAEGNGDARGLHGAEESRKFVAADPEADDNLKGITRKHKDIREKPHDKFKPKVALDELTWDPTGTLQKLAQGHADKCRNEHSANSTPTGKFGENIFVGGPITRFQVNPETKEPIPGTEVVMLKPLAAYAEDAVASWGSEAKNYTGQRTYPNNLPKDKEYGHFTQIVWAGKRTIGCGIAECKAPSPVKPLLDSKTKKPVAPWVLVVCNYDKAGNTAGQQPYPSNWPIP